MHEIDKSGPTVGYGTSVMILPTVADYIVLSASRDEEKYIETDPFVKDHRNFFKIMEQSQYTAQKGIILDWLISFFPPLMDINLVRSLSSSNGISSSSEC